ncbi:uncharacterized protein [Aegilops tauschii subsp. strangulata]|uniref:uncharacterized protein isoform X2 n=1 Tax=Aegilops tauschii subsp. strangulata TaxID=200361 RepID=UPI001ABD1E2D|nr:uncharacterized protein LOC120969503 isoform X2 [Aegilops tauschii subsp. strangulata]
MKEADDEDKNRDKGKQTHQAILEQYGNFLMGTQVPGETMAQGTPISRGPVPVDPVTSVHPYVGAQYVQQQQAGTRLAFQTSSSPFATRVRAFMKKNDSLCPLQVMCFS